MIALVMILGVVQGPLAASRQEVAAEETNGMPLNISHGEEFENVQRHMRTTTARLITRWHSMATLVSYLMLFVALLKRFIISLSRSYYHYRK